METYDTIIIGGSYAGLSAAMTLGRSLRKVLIIDSAEPCNRQTPYSHNFITQDGETPAAISKKAREQVLRYPTVSIKKGFVSQAHKHQHIFKVRTWEGEEFTARKLLFTTGIIDIMPNIPGFAECWGISVLHCPYCHGYEIRNQVTGIIANGDMAFDYAKMISTRTDKLTLFTNGKATLSQQQLDKLKANDITVCEKTIKQINHNKGMVNYLEFTDGSTQNLQAIYSRQPFKQHCDLPEQLNCELTELGFIKVDEFQATSVNGIFAAGDNATMFRSVAVAVADGTKAGAVIDKQLIHEDF